LLFDEKNIGQSLNHYLKTFLGGRVMFISKIRKPMSFLLIIAMLISIMLFPGYVLADSETDAPWDLRNFVQNVTIFDMSSGSPTLVNQGEDTLYIGNTYKFAINFAETAQMDFVYNQDGVLLYQLPRGLNLENPVEATSIYHSDTDTHIGWYEIDNTGLVAVWFDDTQDNTSDADASTVTSTVYGVTQTTNASTVVSTVYESNYDVIQDDAKTMNFTIEIFAELTEEAGEFLNFGNGIIISIIPGYIELMPLAAGESWNLSDFVTNVTMYDTSTGTPLAINPGDPTFLGNTYLFVIEFAETSQLQLAYTESISPFPDGMLVFQLPVDLTVPTAILQTPLYSPNNNAVIGWYTIDTNGLVLVWFDNVDMNGNPTPGGANLIDYYANVTLTLNISAQLTGGEDGNLDFGNGIIVEIDPPQPPQPSLTMHKSSRYDPASGIIYYMITITALSGPVTNINLADSPTINNIGINNPTTLGQNAFSLFTYQVNRVDMPPGTMNPLPVNWPSTNPAMLTYNFGPSLTLGPGDFITIRYNLNIQQLIENNPGLVPSQMVYDFNIENIIAVWGYRVDTGAMLPPVNDSTVDHVKKAFPMVKNGTLITGNEIEWVITIGDSYPTALNEGIITDILDSRLSLPVADAIYVSFYDHNGISILDTTLDQLAPSISSTIGSLTTFNVFQFTVPAAPPYIYKIVIDYVTPIPVNLVPHPGMPAIIFENDVNIAFPNGEDFGTGGRVPITTDTVNITKTTSGICGNPTDGYWVDYTITVYVPAGLAGQRLYLYDTLTLLSGGASVPNTPMPLPDGTPLVTAVGVEVTSVNPLLYTPPIIGGTNGSSWRIYFGSTSTTIPDPAASVWQFNQEVTLTIAYRIYLNEPMSANLLDTATSRLQGNMGLRLYNAIYLINSSGEPNIGSYGNSVGSANVSDYWPLFKIGAPTEDPALFNYTVTIKGGYSDRTDPLFRLASNPTFTDTFDPVLGYMPNSFYIRDMTTGDIFAPANDLTVTSNTFTVYLNQLHLFNSPPAQGGTSQGMPANPNWFAQKHNFEARYQLYVLAPYLGNPILGMENVVQISVNADNPNACVFENNFTVSYVPQRISKTMTPSAEGSDLIHVDIVINADGSAMFDDASNPTQPALITAKDVLTNLAFFTDTVAIYTQTQVNGVWDGLWVSQPYTFNTRMEWSVNIVNPSEIDFVLPNETPIRITYDTRVTLAPNTPGTISNAISIFGESASDGQDGYTVGNAGVGIDAGFVDVRLFKQDYVGNNLSGANFTLYVTDLSTAPVYNPPAGLPVALSIPGGGPGAGGAVFNFAQIDQETTDANGMAILSNQWLNSSPTYRLLFLLVENEAPYGYVITNERTFFTLNPAITATDITSLENILGEYVNQISDFITITNSSERDLASTLRVRKMFNGLTDAQIQQYLQGFEIVITDPLGIEHVFGLADALDPFGIVLSNITPGIYFITERNYDITGFTLATNPQMPLRRFVMPNAAGEVVILIENTYTPTRSLTVNKVFEGLTADQLPQDFALVVTGSSGFSRTLSLTEAVYGVRIDDLPLGTYTITETGSSVPGFNMTVNPQLPYVIDMTDPYTVYNIEITITNTYTPQPPTRPRPPRPPLPPVEPPTERPPTEHPHRPPGDHPPTVPPTETEPPTGQPPTDPSEPPTTPTDPVIPEEPGVTSPQTGDNRQMALFIALLVAGIICMGAAVIYGYRRRLSLK